MGKLGDWEKGGDIRDSVIGNGEGKVRPFDYAQGKGEGCVSGPKVPRVAGSFSKMCRVTASRAQFESSSNASWGQCSKFPSATLVAEVGDSRAIADHFTRLKPSRKIACTFGRRKVPGFKKRGGIGSLFARVTARRAQFDSISTPPRV